MALLQMDSLMQTPMIKDKPAAPSTLGRHNGGNSFDLLMDNLNFQDERSRIVKQKELPKQKQQSQKAIILKTPEKKSEIREKESPPQVAYLSADTFGQNSNQKNNYKSGEKSSSSEEQ